MKPQIASRDFDENSERISESENDDSVAPLDTVINVAGAKWSMTNHEKKETNQEIFEHVCCNYPSSFELHTNYD